MSRPTRHAVLAILLLVLTVSGRGAVAASDDPRDVSSICERAALTASRESGVPLDVLRAISLTETGRRSDHGFLPWPWTVNMEGVGKWFDDPAEARAYVDRHFARGARSFDVGCFQINYRWHGKAFSSIEEMFDPLANARYAARFLRDLHDELGDWSKAAGAYHSRTPKYATRYAARFDRIRARLGSAPEVELAVAEAAPPVPLQVARVNRFPLLRAGGTTTIASLVPLGGAERGTRLFDMSEPRPLVETR